MTPKITSFRGPYRFLSNFYPARVVYEGMEFPTAEHAFQAAKTLDPYWRNRIARAKTPTEAKRIGRMLHLRPFWDEMRLEVMKQILQSKFQDEELAAQLRETEPFYLIEGNDWGDVFWGQTYNKKKRRYEGRNWLGKLLMEIREEL